MAERETRPVRWDPFREFGELETPILLTCTLCVWSAANALKEWVYEQPGMGEHTVNPIVGETNDGDVNNMWADPIQREQVYEALANASSGPATSPTSEIQLLFSSLASAAKSFFLPGVTVVVIAATLPVTGLVV